MRFEQRALILDRNERWAGHAEEWTLRNGAFSEVRVGTTTTLAQIAEFANESWGLVIMDEIGAAVDQTHPLQALATWVERDLENPLLVVSALPYSPYAAEAVVLGATHYSLKPYQEEEFKRVVNQTLRMHRRNQKLWVSEGQLSARRVKSKDALARHQSGPSLPR